MYWCIVYTDRKPRISHYKNLGLYHSNWTREGGGGSIHWEVHSFGELSFPRHILVIYNCKNIRTLKDRKQVASFTIVKLFDLQKTCNRIDPNRYNHVQVQGKNKYPFYLMRVMPFKKSTKDPSLILIFVKPYVAYIPALCWPAVWLTSVIGPDSA